jgi:K+-transporting ATPase ATPase C chain
MLLVLSLLTGLIYPLFITLGGNALWPAEAQGSLMYDDDGHVLGSALLAQKFSEEKYFHPRPSAVDFSTLPSGASNFSLTSAALQERVEREQARYPGAPVPPRELVLASGSGLDPHLSVAAVRFQASRVAEARHFSDEEKAALHQLIAAYTEYPLFGFIGTKMVNIVKLNRALDRIDYERR